MLFISSTWYKTRIATPLIMTLALGFGPLSERIIIISMVAGPLWPAQLRPCSGCEPSLPYMTIPWQVIHLILTISLMRGKYWQCWHDFLLPKVVLSRTGQSVLYTINSRSVSELRGSGKTPWIGTRVVIHRKSSPLRTKIGTVRDVVCGQSNKSGLRVVLILDNYDPSLTNKEYTVDYEHVLEVTSV